MHCFPRCPINLSKSVKVRYIQLEQQEDIIVLSAFFHITRIHWALEETFSSPTGNLGKPSLVSTDFTSFTCCHTGLCILLIVMPSVMYKSLGIGFEMWSVQVIFVFFSLALTTWMHRKASLCLPSYWVESCETVSPVLRHYAGSSKIYSSYFIDFPSKACTHV